MSSEQQQEPFGLFYAWWRGDNLPEIESPQGMQVDLVDRPVSVASELTLDADEVKQRAREGHSLYVARIDGKLVGWGWSAAETAGIGELGITLTMPPANRYLWDFVTLPEWRGQGIYPAIIQEMVRRQQGVQRFWIGHDYGNRASGKGILRAGFHLVASLYQGCDGFYLIAVDFLDRARVSADLMRVPLRD